ncbi:MAG TPA: desulfoferrodoxin family protein [Treponemataceae bacterium]|nr:desulfoferrodoxin family protein [Treponemataceae bacterium]
MKEDVFYLCEKCGNLIVMINDAGINPFCCGIKMKKLVPSEVDAATEKHVPFVTVQGDTVSVQVGEVAHPMTEAHLIKWIYVQTEKGSQLKKLTAEDEPNAVFELKDDKAIAVYEYCNLHGLWKKSL